MERRAEELIATRFFKNLLSKMNDIPAATTTTVFAGMAFSCNLTIYSCDPPPPLAEYPI